MHANAPDRPARRWLSTVPALLLLVWTVVHWTASELSGRMIEVGGEIWPGYALDLRRDQPRPEPPAPPQAAAKSAADDDLIGDLLGDDAPPAPPPADGEADDALIGDLLGDDLPAAAPPADGEADDALIGDLLGDDQPAAAPVAAGPDPSAVYADDLAVWQSNQDRLTPSVRAFRAVDQALGAVAVWGGGVVKHLLVLLLLVCGTTATALRDHIGLRPIQTRNDDRFSQLGQLAANGMVVFSLVALHRANQASGVDLDNPELPLLWAAAFGAMAAINIAHLIRPAPHLKDGGGWVQASLTVPLYAGMALSSSVWFLAVEAYPAGLAVYLQKLTEHAELYIFVGLYVWAGMLLKRTRVAHLGFDLLRPWKMPPELLAALVVLVAAVPTAYSGASGIFVIAVGALIFRELTASGARPQLALAATAMSGSLGVVLRPCLLVVIVAYLNPPTTDVLYGWGKWVFLLTGGLFAGIVLLTREGPLKVASRAVALPASLKAAAALLPYVGVLVGVLALYRVLLDAHLDEHTAPVILPVALLAIIALEAWRRRRTPSPATQASFAELSGDPPPPRDSAPLAATSETAGHIGALVLLMSLSIALGGVFERSEIMTALPADLGSPWLTMAVLVVVLVVIGMLMDPYGAVILVSATIADVAYTNGIDEAHFWMVVLVAFELGYLTPPVALNHLLTRQVVGADTVDAALAADRAPGQSFWRRHERYVLPITVMATALVLVAFVPLLFTADAP